MPVREFTDSTGKQWRAWDVTPDALNPRTREEDYLASLYYTGWLVFETKNESEKRRLYPVPKGWDELAEAKLEVLLSKAEIVPPRKLRSEKTAAGGAASRAIQVATDCAERARRIQRTAANRSRRDS